MELLLTICLLLLSILNGIKFINAIFVIGNNDGSVLKYLKNKYFYIISIIMLIIMSILFLMVDIESYYFQLANLIVSLFVIAFIDFKKKIIPNIQLIVFLVAQLIYIFCLKTSSLSLLNLIITAIVLFILLLINRLTKEQFGMGDVKLLVAINAIFGLTFTIYSMIISLIAMLLFVVPLLVTKKANMKTRLPFAPFFLIGTMIYTILNFI